MALPIAFNISLVARLMRSFFEAAPRAMEETARIGAATPPLEGECTERQTLRQRRLLRQ